MDLMPTFAELTDGKVPDDRIIDGRSISSLMKAEPDAKSPHDSFFYYGSTDLCAVRSGKWKLILSEGWCWGEKQPILELYNLEKDKEEKNNLAEERPDIVEKLKAKMEICSEGPGRWRQTW